MYRVSRVAGYYSGEFVLGFGVLLGDVSVGQDVPLKKVSAACGSCIAAQHPKSLSRDFHVASGGRGV